MAVNPFAPLSYPPAADSYGLVVAVPPPPDTIDFGGASDDNVALVTGVRHFAWVAEAASLSVQVAVNTEATENEVVPAAVPFIKDAVNVATDAGRGASYVCARVSAPWDTSLCGNGPGEIRAADLRAAAAAPSYAAHAYAAAAVARETGGAPA